MKRHSLLESRLNFLHSEAHRKMPFFNYSSRSANFCPQTYKAPISCMAVACALPRNIYFYIILACVYALLFPKVTVTPQSRYNEHLERVHSLEKITGLPTHRCFQDPPKKWTIKNNKWSIRLVDLVDRSVKMIKVLFSYL